MSSKKLLKTKNISDFGIRLKKAIKDMGLNEKQFAEKADIGVSALWEIINKGRRPTIDIALKIHKAGINALFLMTGQEWEKISVEAQDFKVVGAEPIKGHIGTEAHPPIESNSPIITQEIKTLPQGADKEGTKEANVGSSAGSSPWMEIKDDLKKFTELLERGMQREPARPGEVIEVRHPEIEVFKIIDKLISRLNREQLMMLQAKIENQLEEKSEQPTH